MRTSRGRVDTDFSHLKEAACAGCGATAKQKKLVRLPEIKTLTRAFGCPECILKHGTDALAGEIHRHIDLSVGRTKHAIPCGRGCGRWVTRDSTGMFPNWCSVCEQERRAICA